MTEPAWIPPMRSGSSLGPLKALISANLNPQRVSLVAQPVKNPPAMRETWVRSLGGKDPLEKEMATYSSTLAWKITWTDESMGSQRVGHD